MIAQYGCQGLTDKQDLSPLEKSLREDGIKFFRDNGSILAQKTIADIAESEDETFDQTLDDINWTKLTHNTVHFENLINMYASGVIAPQFSVVPNIRKILQGTEVAHYRDWKYDFDNAYAELLNGNPTSYDVGAVLKNIISAIGDMNLKKALYPQTDDLFEPRYSIYHVCPKVAATTKSYKYLTRMQKHHVVSTQKVYPLAPREFRLSDEHTEYIIPFVSRNDKVGEYPYVTESITLAAKVSIIFLIVAA